MPYLNLKLSISPSAETTERLALVLTDLTAQILRKKREVTSVAIECIQFAQWTIGGHSLDSKNSATFFLEVKVTEGTNTKDEKAAYVEAVFKAVASLLGETEPASYIVIQEVRADSWGYGGATQENRYIRGKPL
jgi:4-oxalocrotonate tautomerase